MHLGRHIPGREAGNLADRSRVQSFQIKQDDLSIEWRERLYQLENPLHDALLINFGFPVDVDGHRVDVIEAHKRRGARATPDHL